MRLSGFSRSKRLRKPDLLGMSPLRRQDASFPQAGCYAQRCSWVARDHGDWRTHPKDENSKKYRVGVLDDDRSWAHVLSSPADWPSLMDDMSGFPLEASSSAQAGCGCPRKRSGLVTQDRSPLCGGSSPTAQISAGLPWLRVCLVILGGEWDSGTSSRMGEYAALRIPHRCR